MLDQLIRTALGQRLLVFLGALALAVWGAHAYSKLPIDAFPDVAPVQVLVSMRAPGLTPEELENRVTAPIEIAVRGVPNLVRMRSMTRYSVALLTFEFTEGTDIFWARAQVNERLASVADQLPEGASGGLAPIVTPLAEMLMFTVVGGGLSPTEQRSLVDWTIRPALRSLVGVADVNVLGGFVRTFEVAPSPPAMAARGITVAMLKDALAENNRNDGAGRVRDGEEALLVRAEGRLRTLDDIRSVVVAAKPTGVVRIGDVAEVRNGSLARNGVSTRNGEAEAVWALVLGLRGADASTVVSGVKARLEELKPSLPPGAHIDIFYDRSELIGKAVWTVQKVLLEAIVLVVILLFLFLGNLRAAVVVSLMLPLAALATFAIMRQWGLSANIMSLGGLAIAIGILVDCAVVVVENVEHRLTSVREADIGERIRLTYESAREVATPLISGAVIIITVFLPLLSLEGLEGRLFAPVALTIAFALASALFLSLTVVPALSATLLRAGETDEPPLVRRLSNFYNPLLERALRRPLIVGGIVTAGLALALLASNHIGQTFMPVMDEGTPVITVRKHPTISVDVAAETDMRIERALMARVPEVKGVMGRAGADELGIDPVGLNETDMFLTLAPQKEWRGKGTEWLLGELRQVLESFPGISYSFSQPIDMRVQEMIIGARGDVVVKVFGDDLDELNRLAREVAATLKKIPGSEDVFALKNDGMRYLSAKIDRLAAGRFGLNASEIQDGLRVWVDGRQVGLVLEGPIRTPLMLRGDAVSRRSPVDFARLPVVSPEGKVVELSQLADIHIENGPIQVIREEGRRFATVLANVTGRDLVGFVDEAKAAVARDIKAPVGYQFVWGGQFENQQRASARLAIVVPLALALIFLLLYLTFNSLAQAALVFCNVPFAAIGGVIGLWLSGEFLSVPASVGFIALIGIAVLNGVVLISYINKLVAEGRPVHEAVREGAKRRMRPVVLTATIAAFGLMPFLFASGPGAEIQRPLAIVVIGGLITATALTLVLLPILYDRFRLPRRASVSPPSETVQPDSLLAKWRIARR
ncbi:efflux RND transporter permease subunit [Methylosinus sp. Sm6]|uniref:efflux RND transporter permease subunit n=1 Tax=Methylosinus sp. Sm6 TaxID=2866948 RepID=UPI001C99D8B6|nr:CusA/CzcA family heavy metal efflux RND transporter [Methylosinus sp. Sm6]MBY6242395.1 CusA/CzcA family heavy metal efflux RND transporter [Methylosinus sp. Sm6]